MEGEWSCYRGVHFNRGHCIEVASLKEGEWSCYGGCHFNGMENGHVTEVSIMEGEWSSYGGGQFKGGRMVML